MEIEVQNLTFSYGKQPALREVSFSVQKGTLTAVLGANGAGKSTLFRCLLGFLTPQAGEIRLSGTNPPFQNHPGQNYLSDPPSRYL